MIQLAKENCIDGGVLRAGDAVNFSIGQGDTVITPLKQAQVYSAIANGGTLWQPLVAKAIVKTDGTVVKTFTPKVDGKVEAAPKTVKTDVAKADADEMKKKLEAAGAKVELK
mgnify:CR=1 FL=1